MRRQPRPPPTLENTEVEIIIMAIATLSSVITTLKGLGLSGANLNTAIQSIAGSSPTSAIQSACTTILQNSNNPAVVKDMTTKIAEIPNLPIAVANLLPALQEAVTPLQIVEVVQNIETALGPNTGGLNLGALL
jgi:hypothetical protein